MIKRKATSHPEEEVSYRGIDFVLRSKKSLRTLISELEEVLVANVSHRASRIVVINVPGRNLKPETEISRFCSLIEGLSAPARTCWNDCYAREVDIGIDSGTFKKGMPVPFELKIKTQILSKISAIGAEVKITVYPKEVGPA